jgi:cardiolipin synthase
MSADISVENDTADTPEQFPDGRVQKALANVLGVPFTERNRLGVLSNGIEIFPAMLEAIRSAERQVDLLTFVYWKGDIAVEFAEALAERSRAGVQVRVLLDAFGARQMSRRLVRKLKRSGCEVRWFRPLARVKPWTLDKRTHRKVLVCDDRVAFTGGVGIAEEWEGDARNPDEWRDLHVAVEGPAVHGLRAAFLGNWAESGGRSYDPPPTHVADPDAGSSSVQVLRASSSYGWTDIAPLARVLIALARERLRIVTPYFTPYQDVAEGLAHAAETGVRVEIMMPSTHVDTKLPLWAGSRRYGGLLRSGVDILHYQKTMLHTKAIIVDRDVVALGSANLNFRSMFKDEEVCITTTDTDVIDAVDAHFEADRAECEKVDLADWRERSVGTRLRERLADLISGEV